MDVYLIPVSANAFKCYYEAPEQEEPDEAVEGQGFIARMRSRFNEQLKEAEQSRHQKATDEPTTFLGRMQKRSMRWIAERIAEQRLLWRLRKVDRSPWGTRAARSVSPRATRLSGCWIRCHDR